MPDALVDEAGVSQRREAPRRPACVRSAGVRTKARALGTNDSMTNGRNRRVSTSLQLCARRATTAVTNPHARAIFGDVVGGRRGE